MSAPKWVDKIDLKEKGNLTGEERNEIASALHALLLNEFYSHRSWETHMAVFHGGTALAVLYNSGRFSEDLDFMVSADVYASLEKSMKTARSKVEKAIGAIFPGGSLELSGPKGDKVQNWMFGWTHPNRRGKVKVKVEFLSTPVELLRFYRTAQRPILVDESFPMSVGSMVTGPMYVSSWADKIVAMAERVAFKWRDVYDISYVRDRIEHYDIPVEEKHEAIKATVNIYNTSLQNIRTGLQNRLDEGVFDDLDGYTKSMFDWVPVDQWNQRKRNGAFARQLENAKSEVEEAISLIDELEPRGSVSP